MTQNLIDAAVTNGDIIAEQAKVTIRADSSPDKKEHSQEYTAYYAQNLAGVLALCNGKMEPKTEKPAEGKDERTDEQKERGVCDHVNYSVDLEQRAGIRNKILASLEGPDKAIEKLAKQLDVVVQAGAMTAETRDGILSDARAKAKLL